MKEEISLELYAISNSQGFIMRTKHFLMGITILMTASVAAHDARAHENDVPSISDTLSIQEAVIQTTFASSKSSPLRLTTIDNGQLKQRAAERTYPEMLRGIPSHYATSETGS